MLEIPINANLSTDQAAKEIQDFVNGLRDDLNGIVDPKGKILRIKTEFTTSGEKTVIAGLKGADRAAEKYEGTLKKALATQTGSATNLRQSVNALKQQRDALVRGSNEWERYDARVRQASAALRAQQGVQEGSLTDLRRQRDELIRLRDATARVSANGRVDPAFDNLSKQIRQLDGQINSLTSGFSKFFNVLGKIATVQAGFIAITSAIGAVTGVVNAYVNRTKQLEAFNLALKNVGLTQTQTSAAFVDATNIANRLGAPIQQVEKSYQRMIPALRGVGIGSKESSKFIESITARTQTLGLNTEQSGRLLEAFAQVLSKGKLQAEELNQQISELDGAFRTQLADALGVTVEELTNLVEQGAITAPVFVDAISKMSNGVEELEKRVKSGNATIQQFQNIIGNTNVQILQEIGKQIEPGIRAFLRLSLAVSEFFKAFTQTEAFAALVTIFNQTAKGLEVFVKNLLGLVNVINNLLSPIFALVDSILQLDNGFGGLIGLVINFAGGLLLVKGAIKGLSIIRGLTGQVKEFGTSMIAAGKGVNYLAGQSNKTTFNVFRQGLENVRAGIAGFAAKTREGITGFLGLGGAAEKSGRTFRFSAIDYQKAGLSIENVGVQAKKARPGISAMALSLATGLANAGNNAQSKIGGLIEKLKGLKPSAAGAAAGINGLGAALGRLGASAGNAFNAIKPLLFELAAAAAIGAIISAFGALITVNKKAEEAAKDYASTYGQSIQIATNATQELTEKIEKLRKTTNQTGKTTAGSAKSITDFARAQENAATGNKALGGSLIVAATAFAAYGLAAVAAASSAGTLTVPAAALAQIAVAGVAGAVAVNRLSAASEQLGKSAAGKAFLKNLKDQASATSALEAQLKGLGGEIGTIDFSGFAEGSVNLDLLKDGYDALIESSQEFIAAKEEEIKAYQKQIAALDPEKDKEQIASLQAQITLSKEAVKAEAAKEAAARASQKALSDLNAAAIAGGDANKLQKASVEELTKALEFQNEAIEVGSIQARTKALARYGQLQRQSGQLEAANIAIEAAASEQRLKNSKRILDELQRRISLGENVRAEEIKQAQELTKTVEEETLKQAEIQKQLGDAIVDGFERGIQKAREITGVYGGIASNAKQTFDNVTSSLTTGIQDALSLVDAVAETELRGIEKGSATRKAIILEQLRAAAEVNQIEADLAKLKLDVQNRIAQNEARIAQARFQAEARIAAARGDFDLANAYLEAAAAQGQVIQGLQTAYRIEAQSIELRRQAKDQTLIQKGLQEEIGKSANEAAGFIGVQAKNLTDAKEELKVMSQDARSLSQQYGNAAKNASDIQRATAEIELTRGEQEANNIRDAFNEVPLALDRAADGANQLYRNLQSSAKQATETAKQLNEVEKILNKPSQGGRRGAAVPARAQGGPVVSGQQYLVNDGGGREAFMDLRGKLSMLPAGRNIHWTAPRAGTVIPANYVDQYRKASGINEKISSLNGAIGPNDMRANAMTATLDSGNLIQRVASAMTNSGSTQRITNNVTIQSQEPVTDASKIMTNVARMRLRNARGI